MGCTSSPTTHSGCTGSSTATPLIGEATLAGVFLDVVLREMAAAKGTLLEG